MLMQMSEEFTCLVPSRESGTVMCKGKFRKDCKFVNRRELGKYKKNRDRPSDGARVR